MQYETFLVDITDKIAHVRFNRPEKSNALNQTSWKEMEAIFDTLDRMPEVRAIILSGEGKNFCAGIDIGMLMGMRQDTDNGCGGRMREDIRGSAIALQNAINAIEHCRKPVLAAIQRACVGGGIDITTACDMRYATEDAFFSIAEIDMGLVADLGTLQRMPKLIPHGVVRELAYTGRRMAAHEAQEVGLVNRVFADKAAMMDGVLEIAQIIASKSPLSIRGTKEILNHARDHSVEEGLRYVATWNGAMILSNDLTEAMMAKMEQRDPIFED